MFSLIRVSMAMNLFTSIETLTKKGGVMVYMYNSKNKLQAFIFFFFYHVGSKNPTQIVQCGGQNLSR